MHKMKTRQLPSFACALSEAAVGGNTVGLRTTLITKCFLTKQKYILTRFNETKVQKIS